MIRISQQHGHSKRNGRISTEKGNYDPPRVFSETALLLESDLLGASTWTSTNIEIGGQDMKGLYFEDDDIVTDSNKWFD